MLTVEVLVETMITRTAGIPGVQVRIGDLRISVHCHSVPERTKAGTRQIGYYLALTMAEIM
jgi:hypothetical protein